MNLLEDLCQRLKKFYPEAYSDKLKEYCLNQEFTGYLSLKYIIYRLREKLDDKELFSIFRQIAENIIVYGKNPNTDRLDSLPCLYEFRGFLRQKPDLIENMQRTNIAGFTVVINDTNVNLTKQIFSDNSVDAIIFSNINIHKNGIIFRHNGKMVNSDAYHHFIQRLKAYNIIIQKPYNISFERQLLDIDSLIEILKKSYNG